MECGEQLDGIGFGENKKLEKPGHGKQWKEQELMGQLEEQA